MFLREFNKGKNEVLNTSYNMDKLESIMLGNKSQA